MKDSRRRHILKALLITGVAVVSKATIASPLASVISSKRNDELIKARRIGADNIEVDGWILKNTDLMSGEH